MKANPLPALERLKRSYENLGSLTAVARTFGCSVAKVTEALREAGVLHVGNLREMPPLEKLIEMNKKMTVGQMGSALHMTPKRIRQVFNAAGHDWRHKRLRQPSVSKRKPIQVYE